MTEQTRMKQQPNHNDSTCKQQEFRKLPAVDLLLNEAPIMLLSAEYGAALVTDTVRELLDTARAAIGRGASAPPAEQWPALINERLDEQMQPSLQPVINATGIIIHTNLGRAPLSEKARQAVGAVSSGYNNLEYDLDAGKRGSRYDHARTLLCQLSGAEDALVVNNCASAIFLVLMALCQEQEVLISRGELVEIGGGFRIPDILRQSGAHLVEVGTTNRTRSSDFAENVTSNTAALMRVHSSNFKQIGFIAMPTLGELAEIALDANAIRRQNRESSAGDLLVIDDLGSGSLIDTSAYGLAREPLVQESIAAGADIVAFSGDKLLGGPQAGILVGRAEPIARLRRHPLARALRVDKMTLAALDATLRSYQRQRALEEIPVWRMISTQVEVLSQIVDSWQGALAESGIHAEQWDGESAVGGGSLPGETLPTKLLAIASAQPDAVANALRTLERPVVCRIQHDHLLFDPRTVQPTEHEALLAAIRIATEQVTGSAAGGSAD